MFWQVQKYCIFSHWNSNIIWMKNCYKIDFQKSTKMETCVVLSHLSMEYLTFWFCWEICFQKWKKCEKCMKNCVWKMKFRIIFLEFKMVWPMKSIVFCRLLAHLFLQKFEYSGMSEFFKKWKSLYKPHTMIKLYLVKLTLTNYHTSTSEQQNSSKVSQACILANEKLREKNIIFSERVESHCWNYLKQTENYSRTFQPKNKNSRLRCTTSLFKWIFVT